MKVLSEVISYSGGYYQRVGDEIRAVRPILPVGYEALGVWRMRSVEAAHHIYFGRWAWHVRVAGWVAGRIDPPATEETRRGVGA